MSNEGGYRTCLLWYTADRGRTWSSRQLTHDPNGFSIRPVSPRGLRSRTNQIVFGDNRTIGYRDLRTRIHALEF